MAQWLKTQNNLLLVGPDSESEQWVSDIADYSQHPFVIGEKQRFGDRHVEVSLPNIEAHRDRTAVIIDDVISSGQTILECIKTLNRMAKNPSLSSRLPLPNFSGFLNFPIYRRMFIF